MTQRAGYGVAGACLVPSPVMLITHIAFLGLSVQSYVQKWKYFLWFIILNSLHSK